LDTVESKNTRKQVQDRLCQEKRARKVGLGGVVGLFGFWWFWCGGGGFGGGGGGVLFVGTRGAAPQGKNRFSRTVDGDRRLKIREESWGGCHTQEREDGIQWGGKGLPFLLLARKGEVCVQSIPSGKEQSCNWYREELRGEGNRDRIKGRTSPKGRRDEPGRRFGGREYAGACDWGESTPVYICQKKYVAGSDQNYSYV